jgi:hypothetical protein
MAFLDRRKRKNMWDKLVPQSLKRHHRAKMAVRLATVLVLGWWSASGGLLAQDSATPASQPLGGLQIRTVSAYVGYYSKTLPGGGVQPGAAALPSDVSGGGSAVLEWTKNNGRSTFDFTYTPSYTGRIRYSELNAFNHALSFNVNRKLAPRWNFSFSVAGNLSSVEQSLFAPTALSNVASVPSTFDDLAAGILSSKFTNNPQLANALTSAPLVESPLRNLLYGQRMFTSSAIASVSYSYSPRLSVIFSGGGARSQRVSDGQAVTPTNTSLLANTTSGNASVAISYSLSPLTQLGGTVTTNRASSAIEDVYTTTSLVSLGRTFGRRWFTQIHGGVGVSKPIRQTAFALSTKPHPAGGGSLGFKTFSHTLLGSYDRTVSDSYGLGASTTSSATAAWQLRRPGSTWSLDSSVGWQQLGGNALTSTSGWHASAGFGRAIGTHVSLLTQYTYLYYSGQLQKSAYSLSQSAVRISLVWNPGASLLR